MSDVSNSYLHREMNEMKAANKANMNEVAEELQKMEKKMKTMMKAQFEAKAAFVPMKKIKEILAKLINDSTKLLANKPFGSGE